MSLTDIAIKIAVPVPQLENFQRYLFIGPHPDDIEIGAGATCAKLSAMGRDLCFLICTDGRYGDMLLKKPMPREELTALRHREAASSAEVLGVSKLHFLDLSDGGFYTKEELRRGMAGVIGDFQPDVIFAPDPFVSSESHIDHLNVGECAGRLSCDAVNAGIMKRLGGRAAPVKALAYYMTARPNRYVNTAGFFETQQESIFGCHLSQYPPECGETGALKLYLKVRSIDMGLRSFCRCAEGFRVLGATHLHCLPEAGK